MTPSLPPTFLTRPIAHRALHDVAAGRPENSLAAVRAAISGGFGIEIDVQISADDVAMVFHDDKLDRLTGAKGRVDAREAADLGRIPLKGGSEGVPTLGQALTLVEGRVPLLIEIKDQDGALGEGVGPLEAAVAEDLGRYSGDVAVMSFNPHSMAAMQSFAPHIPRGLVTERFPRRGWSVPRARRQELRSIPDYDRVGASFISHDVGDLASGHVARLKARGVPVLCWTVRSARMEARARRIADNVTFEGYVPG